MLGGCDTNSWLQVPLVAPLVRLFCSAGFGKSKRKPGIFYEHKRTSLGLLLPSNCTLANPRDVAKCIFESRITVFSLSLPAVETLDMARHACHVPSLVILLSPHNPLDVLFSNWGPNWAE